MSFSRATFGALALFVTVLAPDISPAARTAAPVVAHRAITGQARICAHNLASTIALSPSTTELIAVSVTNRTSTLGELSTWTRTKGCWSRNGGPYSAHLGTNGVSAQRSEGDLTTPLGVFGFEGTIYGIDPNPGVAYPYHRIVCGDWWDEDPSSPRYNRFVHEPCGAIPSIASKSEALWKIGRSYDYLAVITFNTSPVVPGRGSGIFLHVDTGTSTAGCVSLPLSMLLRTLRWLRPSAHPIIAIELSAH